MGSRSMTTRVYNKRNPRIFSVSWSPFVLFMTGLNIGIALTGLACLFAMGAFQ